MRIEGKGLQQECLARGSLHSWVDKGNYGEISGAWVDKGEGGEACALSDATAGANKG